MGINNKNIDFDYDDFDDNNNKKKSPNNTAAYRRKPTHSSPTITVSDLAKKKKKSTSGSNNSQRRQSSSSKNKPVGKPVNNTKGKTTKKSNNKNASNSNNKRKKGDDGKGKQQQGGKKKQQVSFSVDSDNSDDEDVYTSSTKKKSKRGDNKKSNNTKYDDSCLFDTDEDESNESSSGVDDVMIVEEKKAPKKNTKKSITTKNNSNTNKDVQVLPQRVLAVDNRVMPTPTADSMARVSFLNCIPQLVEGGVLKGVLDSNSTIMASLVNGTTSSQLETNKGLRRSKGVGTLVETSVVPRASYLFESYSNEEKNDTTTNRTTATLNKDEQSLWLSDFVSPINSGFETAGDNQHMNSSGSIKSTEGFTASDGWNCFGDLGKSVLSCFCV